MKKTPITVIKLGGSLITYKRDTHRIEQYLDQIDDFLLGKGLLRELNEKISDLVNFEHLNEIFKILSSYMAQNPKNKIILIHGAGSIGHSLVLHLLEKYSNLDTVFPIIKLAVAIQNQIIVSEAIKHEINAISFPSHLVMRGKPTEKTSVIRADSPDLSILEKIITETNAVPIFYGDVGSTSSGWKVFSGDIYPATLMKCLKNTYLDSAIFLTDVEGKTTGVYTKDPSFNDAKYITRIEVETNEITCFGSDNETVYFQEGQIIGDFDVTEAMGGKLRNLIELANNYTKCWVVGLNELDKALKEENVGTIIVPKKPSEVNVTFLGTGDAFASGGGKSASTLVEIGKQGILLDCGPQSLQALKEAGRKTNDINTILISHHHGDHFGGVPFFILEASILQRREKLLTIVGPPNTERKVNDLFTILYETITGNELPFPCEFHILTPSTSPLEVNGVKIMAFKMLHTPEAQGYRLETKHTSLAYSGDTGWTHELVPLIKDTQLAIMECNFLDTELDIHLNFNQLSKLCSLTDRMALIHVGTEVINQENLIETKNMFIPLEGQVLRL